MKIGFDVDGVLANFDKAFSRVGKKLFYLPEVEGNQVLHWNWSIWYCNHSQENAMWQEALEDPFFWVQVESLVSPPIWNRIDLIAQKGACYLITNRHSNSGRSAFNQTRWWLTKHCSGNPQIITSSKKGKLCEALGLDAFIDDKFTYCVDIVKSSPATQVFMLERAHNRWIPDQFPDFFTSRNGRAEIIIVKSVGEYLNWIERKREGNNHEIS